MGQHYVPQHYLRGFEVSDQPGMIWTYDKIAKTSKSLPIKLVAQKSGYYEEADETALANQIEGPALHWCIVKTAPPTKSRTYAPLEFRAEDGETPPLCSTLLSSSSHLASVPFGRCVGAAPTWCWRTSLCGSK